MNTSVNPMNELSEELRALLARVPKVEDLGLDALAKAAQDLDADPAFRADLIKGIFVERILQALEERNESQSELAKRWGKSRQYLSKLLNEDKRVNFTVETMCEIVHHLGHKLEILVLRPNEVATVQEYPASDWMLSWDGGGVTELNFPACAWWPANGREFSLDTPDGADTDNTDNENTSLAA